MRAVLCGGGFDRGDQPVVRQLPRVDTAHGSPECVEAVVEVAGGVVEKLRCNVQPCLAQLHRGSHKVLLRAVVQVALDAQPLHLVRLRDPAPRNRQLVDFGGSSLLVFMSPHGPERSQVELALPIFGSQGHSAYRRPPVE